MDELRVRLLGGLTVEGLEPKEVGSRKARTLLAVLATQLAAPVPVDVLADALWGRELPAKPADQIGVLVSRLRGVLGTSRVGRSDAGYTLHADWVDVDELGKRVDDARTHLAGGDAWSARLVASMALDLARGPLLPEEDGEWVERPRAVAGRLVAAAGHVAADAALRSHDPLGAAAAAATALDHDPYDEAALRLLMEAHAAAGRPASALAAYADVRERLAEDLGVSPDPQTEALHARLLGAEPAPAAPASVDGWDPLVQRARVELASNDLAAARRDADEAVRRGGGPGALEMAGWMAYYTRDFPAALRWAEEAAARTGEDERRASCLTLAGRVRHSYGDLHGAERCLEEAARSDSPGVRAMAEVWLGSLRVHQGRPAEGYELARRGNVDAAALRHPFVIAHSCFGQVYSLLIQGHLASATAALEEFDGTLADLGGVGERYRPAALNFWGWLLSATGRPVDAAAAHAEAFAAAGSLQEPKAHSQLDLARLAVEAGDAATATRRLDEVAIPPDEAGTMAWHQRQRLGLLRAQVALVEGDPERAEVDARAVRDDAATRGARRTELLSDAVVLEARARAGATPPTSEVRALLDALEPVAGLECWRVTARLGAALDDDALRAEAHERAAALAAGAGEDADRLRSWLTDELARLGA